MDLPKEIAEKCYDHPEMGKVVDCFYKSDVDIFGFDGSVPNAVPVSELSKGYTLTPDGIVFNDC